MQVPAPVMCTRPVLLTVSVEAISQVPHSRCRRLHCPHRSGLKRRETATYSPLQSAECCSEIIYEIGFSNILSDVILLISSGQVLVTTDSFYASVSRRGSSGICFRSALPSTHSCCKGKEDLTKLPDVGSSQD